MEHIDFIRFRPVLEMDNPQVSNRIAELARETGCSTAQMEEIYRSSFERDQHFKGSGYQITVREHPGGMTQISVIRDDRRSVTWREMQDIKNLFIGEESEAVQLQPAESRLVDTAPNFHLWVLPHNQRFPFGFERGRVVTPNEVLEPVA